MTRIDHYDYEELLPRSTDQGGGYRLISEWKPDEITRDFLNPSPEEVEEMAALGREPGAVGYDGAGRLVRVRQDGSLEVLPDDESKAGQE